MNTMSTTIRGGAVHEIQALKGKVAELEARSTKDKERIDALLAEREKLLWANSEELEKARIATRILNEAKDAASCAMANRLGSGEAALTLMFGIDRAINRLK
jgi:hypothetical protein